MAGSIPGKRTRWRPAPAGQPRRYLYATLAVTAGVLGGYVATRFGVRPEYLAGILAIGFAGLVGVGKRAAP
jgi:hypothetical protein